MNENKQTVNVTVAGGYQPSVIKLKRVCQPKSISNGLMTRGAWILFIPTNLAFQKNSQSTSPRRFKCQRTRLANLVLAVAWTCSKGKLRLSNDYHKTILDCTDFFAANVGGDDFKAIWLDDAWRRMDDVCPDHNRDDRRSRPIHQ